MLSFFSMGTLGRHALRIGRTHDKCKPSQSWGVQIIVVNDGLKAALVSAMIQFDLGDSGSVERNHLFGRSRSQELIFIYEEKFRGRIDEASNQSRTGNSIDFDVLAGDLFHRRLRDSAFPAYRQQTGHSIFECQALRNYRLRLKIR